MKRESARSTEAIKRQQREIPIVREEFDTHTSRGTYIAVVVVAEPRSSGPQYHAQSTHTHTYIHAQQQQQQQLMNQPTIATDMWPNHKISE